MELIEAKPGLLSSTCYARCAPCGVRVSCKYVCTTAFQDPEQEDRDVGCVSFGRQGTYYRQRCAGDGDRFRRTRQNEPPVYDDCCAPKTSGWHP